MGQEIFRQKSLDRIKSPEGLNDYVKVASPSVWVLLVAIIVLLLGAFVWGIFGRVDTVIDAVAISDNSGIICYVSEDRVGEIKSGMKVDINDNNCNVLKVGGYNQDRGLYEVIIDGNLPEGTYSAKIIVDSEKPIAFVTN